MIVTRKESIHQLGSLVIGTLRFPSFERKKKTFFVCKDFDDAYDDETTGEGNTESFF